MSTHSDVSAASVPAAPLVPPLETGDCLSRAEFERRYEAMPWLKNAELVEGLVYVGSPVGPSHGLSHARLMTWLGVYSSQTPGTDCTDNTSLRLDLLNEFQPDAFLRVSASGRTRISKDKPYFEGSPELVAEVASTSAGRDLHGKLNVYRRHGVAEYIVWRVQEEDEEDLDWFRLEEGEYRPLAPEADGVIRSREFPGLWLDKAALLRGDMPQVLAVLNQGLSSPEHADFVTRLAISKA